MTPKERARKIVFQRVEYGKNLHAYVDMERLGEEIAAAITEAVEAERQACAEIVRTTESPHYKTWESDFRGIYYLAKREAADAIEARKTMTKTFEDLVEFRAKTIYENDPDSGYRDGDEIVPWCSNCASSAAWDGWRKIARATLLAEWKAGVVCVPKKITGAMLEAVYTENTMVSSAEIEAAISATPYMPRGTEP